MFVQTSQSQQNVHINALEKPKIQTKSQEHSLSSNHSNSLLQEAIEDSIGGILILTEQRELIHTNDCARRMLRLLNRGKPRFNLVPDEVWHVCRALIESRDLFPNQHWLMESKIFIHGSITLHIRAKWFTSETIDRSYLLLVLQDQYQLTKDIAAEEAQKYGLTSREKEVWLLHRANYTYKQISSELQITLNTVKKHMKSIHIKQKTVLEVDD